MYQNLTPEECIELAERTLGRSIDHTALLTDEKPDYRSGFQIAGSVGGAYLRKKAELEDMLRAGDIDCEQFIARYSRLHSEMRESLEE